MNSVSKEEIPSLINRASGRAKARIQPIERQIPTAGNLQSFIEAMAESAFVFDLKGHILYANSAAGSRLGYLADELRKLSFFELHPAAKQEQAQAIFDSIVNGRLNRHSCCFVNNSGAVVRLDGRFSKVRYQGRGVVLGLLQAGPTEAIANGVPSMANAEILSVFDSINELVYVTDPQTYEILYINKYAKEALGKNPIGKTCYTVLNGIDKPCPRCRHYAGEKGKVHRWEYHNRVLKRDYIVTERIVNWLDGKEARFELALDITETKKAEEEIQLWKKRYETAVLASGQVLYDWNCATNNVTHGGQIEQILGYSTEDMKGSLTCWTELIHPDDQSYFGRSIEQLVQTKGPAKLEYRVRKKDGSYIIVEDNGLFVPDADGNLTRMIGFIKDITHQKQSQQSLQKSLKYEKAIAACSHILLTESESSKALPKALEHLLRACEACRICIFENHEDTEGNLVMRLNEEVWRDGQGIKNRIDIRKLPYRKGFHRWQQLLSHGKIIAGAISDMPETEAGILKKGRVVSTLVIPIFVAGQWYGFISFDDTKHPRQWSEEDKILLQTASEMIASHLESRWANEMLRESEERFRTMADFTYDFEYWVGPDDNLIYVSPSCHRITGYTAEEFLQNSELLITIISEENREVFKQHFLNELNDKEVFQADLCIKTKSGQLRWVSHVCQPVYGTDGRWLGRRASNTDITARKATEKRLLAYQKQLRTLASELMLVEEKERTRLAQGLHDDIAQNMALAKLKLQSLAAKTSDPATVQQLSEIYHEFDYMIDTIHSLTFELGNPVLYELGLKAAIQQLLQEEVERRHGIKCILLCEDDKLDVDRNTSMVLFRAIRELLVNVIKHARATKVDLKILLKNDKIRVWVKDNGIGFISDSEESAPETKKTGGFGLFAIRERLEYLGGKLSIKSQPGTGTIAVLAVPSKQQSDSQREIL